MACNDGGDVINFLGVWDRQDLFPTSCLHPGRLVIVAPVQGICIPLLLKKHTVLHVNGSYLMFDAEAGRDMWSTSMQRDQQAEQ